MADQIEAKPGVLLIIDDDEDIRDLLCRTAEQAMKSLKVLRAENGRQGLEIVVAEPVDIILCDLNMPVMNGMSFFEALRGQGNHTPVIFLTGFGEDTTQAKALGLGAYDFLAKPFQRDDLVILLNDAMKTSRKLRDMPKREAG